MITIIILLVLAGVVIATLGGENGLIAHAKQAKQAQIESDMKEQLTLAMQDLQIEKLGDATLDDVTQEWIDSKIKDYECTVKDDLSISGKKITMEKGGIIGKFLIDERLNITEIEKNGNGAKLEYEVVSRNGEKVTILLTITDKENGLQQVEFPDGNIIYCNGNEEFAKDYEVQLGVEYKVKITSKGGRVKEETILINDYYYTITKNLGEGISIDNPAVKAAYNKPYKAKITTNEGYIIDTLTVKMGEQEIIVDKTTGTINIEKVTGNIEITASELEISSISDEQAIKVPTLYGNDKVIYNTEFYLGYYEPYRAFDKKIHDSINNWQGNGRSWYGGNSECFIGYEFDEEIRVYKFSITNSGHSNGSDIQYGVKDIGLQYCNSEGEWIEVMKYTNSKNLLETTNFYNNNLSVKSKKWRIYVYNSYDDYGRNIIGELQFFGI